MTVWENLHKGVLLGSKGFVEELKPLPADKAKEKAILKAEHCSEANSCLAVDTRRDKEKQNVKMYEAIRRCGYTLSQMEAVVDLNYLTISRIAKKWNKTSKCQNRRNGNTYGSLSVYPYSNSGEHPF